MEIILVDDKIAFFKTYTDHNGKEITVREVMTYERLGYQAKQQFKDLDEVLDHLENKDYVSTHGCYHTISARYEPNRPS